MTGLGVTGTNVLRIQSSTTADDIAAFVAVAGGAFETDAFNKNSGYPVLEWENKMFSGGKGTATNPYLIANSADLVKLAEVTKVVGSAFVDKYYKLTADIDMTGIDFEGICANETEGIDGRDGTKPQFKGKIDGDYHIISNMTVDKSDNWNGSTGGIYSALICWANEGAEVKNLGLVNVSTKGYSGAGGIIGRTLGAAKIENCFVRGIDLNSEKSNGNGALICEDNGSTIKNSYTTVISGNTPYTGAVGHGTHGGSENVYTLVTGLGVTGTNVLRIETSTTADAVSAFVAAAGGAFVEDTGNINNGKPILAWETGKLTAAINYQDNKAVINNFSDETVAGIVIIAAYGEDDQMIDVCGFDNDFSVDVNLTEKVPFTEVTGALKYKAFVWDNFDDMSAKCAPAEYVIQ